MHQARFGFTRAGEAIELVDVAPKSSVVPRSHGPTFLQSGKSGTPAAAKEGQRRSHLLQGRFGPGTRDRGPGSVIEQDSAVWLEPGDRMWVQEDGTLDVAS